MFQPFNRIQSTEFRRAMQLPSRPKPRPERTRRSDGSTSATGSSVWQHHAQTTLIRVIHDLGLVEFAFALAAFRSQDVASEGMSTDELPASGRLEPFCRATMCFNFGH